MNMTKHLLSLIGAAAMAGTAGAVNVTIDKVQQRYPWNGLVDIDYTLDGGVAYNAKFDVTVTADGKTYAAKTFLQNNNGNVPASGRVKGTHRLTWDSAADNAKFFSKNAKVTMSIVDATADFMIYDLVNNTSFKTNCTAEALNTDEFKTTKLAMRIVPATTFSLMGTTSYGTRPTHLVSLSSYAVGLFPVTQEQWYHVMGNWPSYFSNTTCRATRPVERVSYMMIRGSESGSAASNIDGVNYDDGTQIKWPSTGSTVSANSFLGKLRAKFGDSVLFDLPTEAQWNDAYQAGTTTYYFDGTAVGSATIPYLGRCTLNNGARDNSVGGLETDVYGTAKVGSYMANGYGLYDIAFNVRTWVLDYANYYTGEGLNVSTLQTDPAGATSAKASNGAALGSGELTVARFTLGGSFFEGLNCGSAIGDRWRVGPSYRDLHHGFRLASPVTE